MNEPKKIIDISPLISNRLAVWPGDQSFSQKFNLKLSEGSNIDLSSIHTTVHLGAHADAPSHFMTQGLSIDQVPLSPYVGPAQVIETQNLQPNDRILPEHLVGNIQSKRVLLKTGSFPNSNNFNEDFNSLSPELVEFMSSKGVILIGIDTPSIDPFNDKELKSHETLGRHRIYNLEGLVLAHVSPGIYGMSALPLSIEGSDASPVRAILWT